MHPVLTNARYLLLYLLAWLPFGLLIGLLLSLSAHASAAETAFVVVPFTVLLAFLCLAPLYMCRALPVGSTPLWKLTLNHFFAALAILAVVHPVIALTVRAGERIYPDLGQKMIAGAPLLTASTLLIYLLSVGSHYTGLALESSRKAQILAREAELRALKAQVNPHFLFNSLNSISALTSIDSARAREMCVTLSEFLRLSLRLGDRPSIPVEEELEVVRTYLNVEQTRFGARLRVSERIDAACSGCEVPPLLLQPLIENAIKHGVANLVDGGDVAIETSCLNGQMQLTVENQFDPEAPLNRRSNGIGLRNVRERLSARYGPAARLNVEVEKNCYRVTLHLPCEKAAAAGRRESL